MVSNKYLTTTVDNIVNTDLYTLVPTFAKYKSVCRYKERKIEKNTKIYKIKTVLAIKLEKNGNMGGWYYKKFFENENITYSHMKQNKQKLWN